MPVSEEGHRDRAALTALQSRKVRLLADILPKHPFYMEKFAQAGIEPADLAAPADLSRLPFTTKAELLAEQVAHPPYGRLLTYPRDQYSRLHLTSGTSGQPLRWLDTPASWSWLLDCWDLIYDLIEIRPADRFFFPFSFGPFLGFWTAFEAAARRGHLCLPGGGMSGLARLRFLLDHDVSIVCCTPTYALHLGETARQEGIDLPSSSVRLVIVAGEPGGNIPETRAAIQAAWGARLIDHSGLTELGPLGIECLPGAGSLHVLETDWIAEVIDPGTGEPVALGNAGELVLTTLGRLGSPLLRYRTGDLVQPSSTPCPCGRCFLRLEGGILGRVDDMIHVRGNNVYPSALESVIRRFPEVAEFRIEVDQSGPLTALRIEVEPVEGHGGGSDLAARVGRALRDQLLFRMEVTAVPVGSLPRFEMKARRVVRRRLD